MALEFIIWTFGASLLLYVILGGADFGAGIVELFTPRVRRDAVRDVSAHAIAPVWEANHIWLILAVVILFVAFPKAYSEISTYFHIPLLLMLFGIVLRGCAFVFRHYDPQPEEFSSWYNVAFSVSSLLTPLLQGMIVGGCMLGIPEVLPQDFHGAFLNPWLNYFSLAVGIFYCGLCHFLAATFLVGETKDAELKVFFQRRSSQSGLVCLLLAAIVYFLADKFVPGRVGASSLFPLTSLVALSSFVALILFQRRLGVLFIRALASLAVGGIIAAWLIDSHPFVFGGSEGGLSFFALAAPQATLSQLALALLLGMGLVLPAFIYLLLTFKSAADYPKE